jgi:hypothetical protein
MKQRDRRGMTRRQIAVAAFAAPAIAQTPQSDELQTARAQAKRNGDELRKFKIPQLLEPSFSFRP